jgi:hypothetical protein
VSERRFDWAAALLLLALIITGWFCLAGLGLQRTVLETRFYQDLTARLELAGYLRGRLLGALGETHMGAESLLSADLAIVDQALEATLSTAWLEEQLNEAAGAVAAFIRGESPGLVIAVDLRERLAVFEAELLAGLRRTAPPALAHLEISEAHVKQFMAQLGLPAELVLIDTAAGVDEAVLASLEQLRRAAAFLKIAPVIMLALLALACFFKGGFSGGLALFGGGAALSGLTFLAPLFAAREKAIALMQGLCGVGAGFSVPGLPDIFGTAYDAAQLILVRLALFYAGAGLALLLCGLIGYLLGRFLARRRASAA